MEKTEIIIIIMEIIDICMAVLDDLKKIKRSIKRE